MIPISVNIIGSFSVYRATTFMFEKFSFCEYGTNKKMVRAYIMVFESSIFLNE